MTIDSTNIEIKNLCVIPARGGSKRIPGKNINDFCGKPIIAYSIEAAIKSALFEHIVVSTDSEEIAEVAIKHGAEVPFLRPKELSDDFTPTRPVVNHAISEVTKIYNRPYFVCCLYSTAPFIRTEDLVKGYNYVFNNDIDFAFSVTSYAFPIQRALKLSDEGYVVMFQPEHLLTRSQDLEEAYHDAGQFYWGKTSSFMDNRLTYESKSVPIILPRRLVQDLDTMEDWERAIYMYKAMKACEL
jgi:pseudaminic acid cytidylyltransferase